MRPYRSMPVLAILALATMASLAHAVNKVPGNIQTVPEITTFRTWGGPAPVNNMVGMEVTVEFSSGVVENMNYWTAAPVNPVLGLPVAAPGGGVVGNDGDWSLVNRTPPPQHSFGSEWELEYLDTAGKGNLVAIEFDGFGKLVNTGEIDGNTAFDTTHPINPPLPNTGTPNSAKGRDFNVIGNTHDATATYSDAIRVNGNPVVGDLYRRLRIDFEAKVDTKWRQRPVPTFEVGENLHSDVDWRLAMTPDGDSEAVADDFISDGRPITGVRWWGSYFRDEEQPQPDPTNQNLVPPVEEGYVISFFESIPGEPIPGPLLGMYLAPADAVDIQPTPFIGWDQHPVWEYVVDLDETLLEHAADIARPDAFHEVAETEYWISIAAEDGLAINVDAGEVDDTGDPTHSDPWWGWHTTPERSPNPNFADDQPFAADILMDGDDWVYAPWHPAPQFHAGANWSNLAFELLTVDPNSIGLDGISDTSMNFYADTDTVVAVPEPVSAAIAAVMIGLIAALPGRRRRCDDCSRRA